jgi:hypothetical protein
VSGEDEYSLRLRAQGGRPLTYEEVQQQVAALKAALPA